MLGSSAALDAIRATFSEPVTYLPGGSAAAINPLPVIWSDTAGGPFQGAGETTRTITAEVAMDAVPGRPTKATRIVRDGVQWKVIEVTDREDVAAWVVTLERA